MGKPLSEDLRMHVVAAVKNGLSRRAAAERFENRVQLTTDGHKAYLEAVEGAFGGDVDYAILHKVYGASPESSKGKYSPADCIGVQKHRVEGNLNRPGIAGGPNS